MKAKSTSTLAAASACLLLGLADVADAAVIIPSGIAATSFLDANRDISHTISGAGLSGGGDPILDQTHNTGVNGTYWLGALADNQVLTMSFTGTVDLGAVHIWQYQRENVWDNRSIKSFDISFSTDGGGTYPTTIVGLTGLLGSETDPIANPVPVQTIGFAAQTGVTHVQISNIENFGDATWNALAEIRFGDAVPEPGSGILAALALSLGLCRRRR